MKQQLYPDQNVVFVSVELTTWTTLYQLTSQLRGVDRRGENARHRLEPCYQTEANFSKTWETSSAIIRTWR